MSLRTPTIPTTTTRLPLLPQGSFDEVRLFQGSQQGPVAPRLSKRLARSRALYEADSAALHGTDLLWGSSQDPPTSSHSSKLTSFQGLYKAHSLQDSSQSPLAQRLSTRLAGSQDLYRARLLQGSPQSPLALRLSTRLAHPKALSDADSKVLHVARLLRGSPRRSLRGSLRGPLAPRLAPIISMRTTCS